MKKRKLSKFFTSGYLILILLFIYLPIGYLILFSFNEGKSMTNFSGFSLRWYENLFTKEQSMLDSVWITLLVAAIATIVSTVVGTIAAIGLSKARKLIRTLVLEDRGYTVDVIEFTDLENSPKNLMLRARYTGRPRPGGREKAEALRQTYGFSQTLLELTKND